MIRNWWIVTRVDGRESMMAGGPRSKEGGFEVVVRQRDNDVSTQAVRVWGDVYGDELILHVEVPGQHPITVTTSR